MSNPDFYIYVDESKKNDIGVLLAVFIHANEIDVIAKEWNDLRKKIKNVLLKEYPNASNDVRLEGNRLPEIHAVDLCKSDQYYRKYTRGSIIDPADKYWLQHYQWLEDSLEIIVKHEVRYFQLFSTKESEQEFVDKFTQITNKIQSPNGIKHKRKISNFLNDGYLYMLPGLLISIENWLREGDVKGEIICDDHALANEFTFNSAIKSLSEKGEYSHLSIPRFKNSLDEPFLQMSDVICYIKCQVANQNLNSKPAFGELEGIFPIWEKNYLKDLALRIPDPHESNKDVQYYITSILFEIIVGKAVKNSVARKEILQEINSEISNLQS